MSTVILSFIRSDKEISSGIPQFVTIESNIPSTIYYTTDGSVPNVSSSIYIDPIELPDAMTSVILSALGVDGDGYSSLVLSQTFAPDTTIVTVARNVGQEGFVLNRPNQGPDYVIGYDADGIGATFVDVDVETLDIIRKEKGFNGEAEGTAVDIGYPSPGSTNSFDDDGFVPFSTPEKGQFFNPNARMIVIDNRIYNELHLTLRTYGSMSNIYKEFGGKRIREAADDATYISGGFVKRFYDARNNVMVSYYFDHNESKYVKNIQKLPTNVPIQNSFAIKASVGQPLVFQWIYRGRQSIF